MITKINIKNYKSIERAELELSGINVLIGPNGSGKSSVLECIEYFKRAFEFIRSGTGTDNGMVWSGSIGVSIPFRYIVFQQDVNRKINVELTFRGILIDGSSEDQVYGKLLIELEIMNIQLFTGDNERPKKILVFVLRADRKVTRVLDGVITNVYEINIANAHQLFYYTCYRSEFKENVQIVRDFYAKYGLHDVRWVPTTDGQYEIIATTDEGIDVNLADVGSGLNALFPIVVALAFYPKNSTIFIEHPEMHLHPKLQYELAEFFLNVLVRRNYQLVLETHSEHLLYGLLNAVARKKLKPKDLTIYSVRKEQGKSVFEKLKIYEDGSVEGNLQDFLEADIDAFLDFLKA
ncbi:AAA family ATPase [Archaeoglobus sp.]